MAMERDFPMARELNRLSPATVANAKPKADGKPRLLPDGIGLYLQCSRAADGGVNKSWVFRYTPRGSGRMRYMGLGSLSVIGLSDARARARRLRIQVLDGGDPIQERADATAAKALAAAKAKTFDECASAYIAAKAPGWRSPVHARQWVNSITTHASPIIGQLPVDKIDLALVTKVLEPLWTAKTETASRLRGRIELILSWAATKGLREVANPARWDVLRHVLPAPGDVKKVQHHPALAPAAMPEFMAALRAHSGPAAACFQFMALTATRSGEARRARWSEISLKDAVWEIPGDRMKSGRAHRVPLSAPALAILAARQELRQDDQVFSDVASEMSLRRVLAAMNRADIVPHGFRATFKTWASDETAFDRATIEQALAHSVGNDTERAYDRGSRFEKRRRLMTDWARHCAGEATAKVVSGRFAAV